MPSATASASLSSRSLRDRTLIPRVARALARALVTAPPPGARAKARATRGVAGTTDGAEGAVIWSAAAMPPLLLQQSAPLWRERSPSRLRERRHGRRTPDHCASEWRFRASGLLQRRSGTCAPQTAADRGQGSG